MNIIIGSYFDVFISSDLSNFIRAIKELEKTGDYVLPVCGYELDELNKMEEHSNKTIKISEVKNLDKSLLKYYRLDVFDELALLEKFPFDEKVKIGSLFLKIREDTFPTYTDEQMDRFIENINEYLEFDDMRFTSYDTKRLNTPKLIKWKPILEKCKTISLELLGGDVDSNPDVFKKSGIDLSKLEYFDGELEEIPELDFKGNLRDYYFTSTDNEGEPVSFQPKNCKLIPATIEYLYLNHLKMSEFENHKKLIPEISECFPKLKQLSVSKYVPYHYHENNGTFLVLNELRNLYKLTIDVSNTDSLKFNYIENGEIKWCIKNSGLIDLSISQIGDGLMIKFSHDCPFPDSLKYLCFDSDVKINTLGYKLMGKIIRFLPPGLKELEIGIFGSLITSVYDDGKLINLFPDLDILHVDLLDMKKHPVCKLLIPESVYYLEINLVSNTDFSDYIIIPENSKLVRIKIHLNNLVGNLDILLQINGKVTVKLLFPKTYDKLEFEKRMNYIKELKPNLVFDI